MDTLQKNNYDLAKAMSTLVPQGGPVLCRDEMEEWSASEAMLFEEALEKYGKDFNDIRQDFVSPYLLFLYSCGEYLISGDSDEKFHIHRGYTHLVSKLKFNVELNWTVLFIFCM